MTMASRDPESNVHPTKYIAEWCQVTPYHTVNNIYRAKKLWIRLAWLIVVLFAGFLAFYQSSMLVIDYFGSEAGSWITINSDELPKSGGLEWPNMTVCNYATRFRSMLEKQNLSDPYDIVFDASIIDGTDPLDQAINFYKQYQETRKVNENVHQLLTRIKNTSHLFSIDNMTLSQALNAFGRKCDETVIDCGYINEFALHQRVACCDKLYKVRLRNCMSIHPNLVFPKRQPSVVMHEDGIYYLFNPKVTDYYDHLFLHSMPSAGLRFQIYYGTLEGSVPEVLYVGPGTHMLVQLTAEKRRTVVSDYQMLPFYKKIRPCIEGQPYRNVDYPHYYRELCEVDCKIEWHMHECNCTVMTTRVKKGRECVGDAIAECGQKEKVATNFNLTYPDGFNIHKCQSACQEECDFRAVRAYASYSQFPAPAKVKAFTTYMNRALPSLGSNYTEEDAKQLILLEMNYQSIYYKTVMRVEKTSIGTFVSNIGGALGVWTGLSLLGIFQAIVYACMLLGKFLQRLCGMEIIQRHQ